MSAFNNGGGDLKSTNLPAAVLEMIKLIEIKEGQQNSQNKLTTLSTNHQSATPTTTFAGTLDYTEVNDGGEGATIEATDYIGLPFNPGTGGDLTATTLPAALHQLLNLAITAQQAAGVSAISTFSSNGITKQQSYSGSIPIADSIDINGNSVTSAVEIF